MLNDAIVDEVHRIRREWSDEFNHDLPAMVKDLQERFERGEFGKFVVVDRSVPSTGARVRRTGT
jgi:hypothetical protein